MKYVYMLLLALLFTACGKKTTGAFHENIVIDSVATDTETARFESDEESTALRETRLRYTDFTVVLHDFMGYDEDSYSKDYLYPYHSHNELENREYAQAILNIEEQENEDYKETLIVLKDTINLFESFGEHGNDNRINNTLIQIVPNNSNDTFKVSFCYLSSLNEIIDYRKHSNKELETLYQQAEAWHIDEQTPYIKVKDSAGLYFKALPNTPDMVAVKVVNGEIVPVKSANTRKQLNDEEKQWKHEYKRIKKKYALRDTLVVIPGEYDTVATLTKDKKLYGYGYDAFLFRIERFVNGKKAQTKYITINILYGC
ncbi:hypothetical protein GWA97_06345 [Flavobacterium sp. LaA7.5]|nr:hypothetical protein [Flavobacterium salilacus subsp. altitudinum]